MAFFLCENVLFNIRIGICSRTVLLSPSITKLAILGKIFFFLPLMGICSKIDGTYWENEGNLVHLINFLLLGSKISLLHFRKQVYIFVKEIFQCLKQLPKGPDLPPVLSSTDQLNAWVTWALPWLPTCSCSVLWQLMVAQFILQWSQPSAVPWAPQTP